MRNPPRTQQNSIFEPLFSREEELPITPPTHLIHSSSSEWLSSTYSASPCVVKASCNNQLRKAPTTILKEEMGTNLAHIDRKRAHQLGASVPERILKCKPASCDHAKPFPSSTDVLGRSMQAPSRSLSSGNIDKAHDDGSVASKLLSSITKSLSSPSLLSCCKESVRETPYQKTLRLKMMKLQHCAEELGSESSDGAYMYSNGNPNSTFDSFSTMSSIAARALPSPLIPQKDQRGSGCDDGTSPMMISVRSAPNLRCPSLDSRHTSHTKERTFPPPLTHTLARSTSADSFTFSLRAHREDGRFMLREVKVPCRQYLQANRKDGRLTLQLFTSGDEDVEQEDDVHKELEDGADVQQDDAADVQQDENMSEGGLLSAASNKGAEVVGSSYGDNTVLETPNFDGDAEVIELKERHDDDDNVNMDEIEADIRKEANSDLRKDGDLSAKSLLMAAINADHGSEADDVLSDVSADNPRLKVSPLIRLARCEEHMVLQSRSKRRTSDIGVRSMLGLEISSSTGAGGFNMDSRSLSSTIIFKDVCASSLMENVTKLVSSFGLDGGKWCQGKGNSRKLERRSAQLLKDSSLMYNGITSINIGVRKLDKNNGPHKANGVHILDVECKREPPRSDAFKKEGGRRRAINAGVLSTNKSTTLQLDVPLPLNVDWLHNLHCKELSQRNHFANKGFPCVAIRS